MSAEVAESPGAETVAGRSLWMDAWRTLKKNRAAVVSGIIIAFMAVLAVTCTALILY